MYFTEILDTVEQKWLNAGVLEDGVLTRLASGTVQGGSVKPLAGEHIPALCI